MYAYKEVGASQHGTNTMPPRVPQVVQKMVPSQPPRCWHDVHLVALDAHEPSRGATLPHTTTWMVKYRLRKGNPYVGMYVRTRSTMYSCSTHAPQTLPKPQNIIPSGCWWFWSCWCYRSTTTALHVHARCTYCMVHGT